LRIAIVLASLLAGLAVAQDAPPVEEIRGPRALAPRRVVDLGSIPMGSEGSARFAIRNVGTEPLTIHQVDTSCDCTVADYDETIAPGATGYIEASLLTEELDGAVTKGIIARTNDPENSSVKFTLKALVVSRLQVLPQPVVFIRSRAGEGTVGRALIRPSADHREAASLSNFRASHEALVADARKLDAARPRGGGIPAGYPGDWLLEVRFRDDMLVAGSLREYVSFETGLADQPRMRVAVESNLRTPVTLSTERLLLSGSGGEARGTLFASVREGFDPAGLEVKGAPPGLDVRVEAATERMFKVEVRWPGGTLEQGELRFGVAGAWVRLPVALAGGS
jgi:hypothetical protein